MPTPENKARENIDRLLTLNLGGAGSEGRKHLGLPPSPDPNFTLKPGHGFADYLLYVDVEIAAVVQATKKRASHYWVSTLGPTSSKSLVSTREIRALFKKTLRGGMVR